MSIKKTITYVLDSATTESTSTIKIDVKKDGSVISTKNYDVKTRPAQADKYTKWVVFAVAGQSNSVGYDESENTTLSNPNSDPDRIKQLGLFGEDNLKVIPLQSMAQNLQNMTNFGVAAGKKGTKGLHLPLAELIAKHIPEDYGVIVIPVAYGMTFFTKSGGTARAYDSAKMKPVDDDASNGYWTVGNAYHQTLRDRVKYALDLGEGKSVNKFAGVIWCQGEADTATHGGTSSNHGALFQALVNQLATDWADYDACSPTGKMDKSMWFVHDTTLYWRQRSDKTSEGVDVSNIWLQYQKFLGLENVVNILPLEEYTNAVNGGGTRTSSTYNSHYGNNAYRDVIAPRVLDAMLKAGTIYGQAEGARNTTSFGKVITKVSCRSQGLDVKENGEVIWAAAQTNNATIANDNGCGWAAMLFDEDVTEIKFSGLAANALVIYRAETNTFGYQSLLLADSSNYGSNVSSYDRYWMLYADGTSKDLNGSTGSVGWDKIVKDGYTFPQSISNASSDVYTATIDKTNNTIKVSVNGTEILPKTGDTTVSAAVPRLGFIYGWTLSGLENNASFVKIHSITKEDGTVIESAYALSAESLSFTTTDSQTITAKTNGVISNLAVSSEIVEVSLSDKTITVTPKDSGEANITFDITLDNGDKETLTVPVTVDEGVFYNYVKIYGDAVAGNATQWVQEQKPKCIFLKGGQDIPFVVESNDSDYATNITLKDYETAVKPYVIVSFENKTATFVSTPSTVPLAATVLYKGVELADKMYFSFGASSVEETNISYKVKK